MKGCSRHRNLEEREGRRGGEDYDGKLKKECTTRRTYLIRRAAVAALSSDPPAARERA